ncbi:heme NO-binding domain-containing protein [Piscirickettsia litoralis]|uniref:Heme NO-binding domain-containing protein n=1 Tax=Piscirickettsia litoralis TaxID=1891921 RepID=A0ABX3A2W8_9GAMM|nr:heme NO-binding domain-containing protein [Piscirickettsia litoralis]ODN43216.1 hypothetical protein BGC07_10160 [Piscirickettsia litoralis]
MPRRLPKIFTEFVVASFGEDVLAELAEIVPAMQMAGAVEKSLDSVMVTSVQVLAERTGKTASSIFNMFGESLLSRLLEDYQELYADDGDGDINFQLFLSRIESLLHTELKKVIAYSDLPKIDCSIVNAHEYELTYRSPRKLCAILEGVVTAAANHFHVKYQLKHKPCMNQGAGHCVLAIQEVTGEN